MREMGDWREYIIEMFAKNRERALSYLQLTVEEYQEDGDTAVFLLGLRTFVASQGGVAQLAQQMSLDAAKVTRLLSGEEALRLDTFACLLKALGCRLTIEPLPEAMPAVAAASETEAAHVENAALQMPPAPPLQ